MTDYADCTYYKVVRQVDGMKNYIKLLFHVPYMTQIMALNPLMPELSSWCDVQETGVQMKAAKGGH
jgi:hypothetical protein